MGVDGRGWEGMGGDGRGWEGNGGEVKWEGGGKQMSRLEGRQGGFGDALGARTRAGRTLPPILSDDSPQGAKQIKSTKNQQKTHQ